MINSKNKEISWSKRLKKALKKIKEKYILMMLDDFFLQDNVKDQHFRQCLKDIIRDKRISNFSFMPIDYEYPINFGGKQYTGFNLRSNSMRYILTTQCALWRKKDLLSYINKYENAWQFEQYGSLRAKLYKKNFYISKQNNIIFPYKYKVSDGFGVCNGHWLKNNVALFEKNNIKCDYNNLGFYDGNNPNAEAKPPKKNIKWKFKYLLYGGCDCCRMSIKRQICFLFSHPKTYCHFIKNKINFFISKDYFG